MPSLRAKLVNRYLRTKIRPIRLEEMDPVDVRRAMDTKKIPFLPKGVAIEKISEGPVRGEWQIPEETSALRTILYLHGGGYVFGSPGTHRSLTFALAIAAGARVFSVDYRRAPESPCPAAIEDALAAYDWLIAHGTEPENIVIGGDSAGGGLALALLCALKERGSPMPAGAVLYSPWTDLAVTGHSMDENAEKDAMFRPAAIRGGASRYRGALSADDPRVSPLYADIAGLPPLIVFASEDELLRDDAARLVDKVRAAGGPVEFHLEKGLCHVWPVFHPLMPEAKKAIARSAGFIRQRTRSEQAVSAEIKGAAA